jgi:hypothetical protein
LNRPECGLAARQAPPPETTVDETDRDYCLRRAREERLCAELASCEEARLAHVQLAQAFELRAGGPAQSPVQVMPAPS